VTTGKNVVSLDPGKNTAAVSIFKNGALFAVHLITLGFDDPSITGCTAADIANEHFRSEGVLSVEPVSEVMQIYTPGKSRARPSDILECNLCAGAFIGACRTLGMRGAPSRYLPAEWKGQVPKHILAARVLETLTLEEREKIGEGLTGKKTKDHNIFDSVGIGLFHLKRLGPWKR